MRLGSNFDIQWRTLQSIKPYNIFTTYRCTLYYFIFHGWLHFKQPDRSRFQTCVIRCTLMYSVFFSKLYLYYVNLVLFVYAFLCVLWLRNRHARLFSVFTIYFPLKKHFSFDYLTVIRGHLSSKGIQVVSISLQKTMYRTNTKNANNKLSVFQAQLVLRKANFDSRGKK